MRKTLMCQRILGALVGGALGMGCASKASDPAGAGLDDGLGGQDTTGGSSAAGAEDTTGGTFAADPNDPTGGSSTAERQVPTGGSSAGGHPGAAGSSSGGGAPGVGGSVGDAGQGGAEQGATAIVSEMQRDLDPAPTPSEVAQLVDGNTAFALDLYAKLSAEPGNLFLSPYSISAALAMTYAGARGTTKTEMAETLHFALPDATLHAAFNYLDLELAKRAQAELDPDQTGDPFRLNVANALWGQDGYHFESTFLDLLAVNYGAGLRLVDYERAPEPARQTINAWVSDQTEQKIPELIPEGLVDSSTRLVLTNAIYFNASWDLPFDEELTHPGTFHADVGDVTVDMMVEQDNYRYAAGDGYQTIALPYVGDELDMVLVVPEAGKFAEVEGSLADGALDSMLAELQAAEVQLTVPKWSFRSEVLLKDQLSALGMAEAFSTSADFSGMTGTRALCIADVVHEAFVDVDEEGTEAAAATAVIMWETSVPEPIEPIELTVDRPFLFLIRDLPTETVLFLGRVTDPS